MQGVESYWDHVAGERSGCCSRLVGGAWTPGRARFGCQSTGVGQGLLYVRCAEVLRISAEVRLALFCEEKVETWGVVGDDT